ncbi:hypothetical protein BGZ76_000026 [Entomortierella beljakovae]|nr:hypothetical protein BGZ76_000026 [Entomortierella beljakovae]
MAFKGGPRILRPFGRGRTLLIDTLEYEEYYEKHFRHSNHVQSSASEPASEGNLDSSVETYILEGASQIRGIIVADIYKRLWDERTKEELADYWAKANTKSQNGLERMRHDLISLERASESKSPFSEVFSKIFGKSVGDPVNIDGGAWHPSALVLGGFT